MKFRWPSLISVATAAAAAAMHHRLIGEHPHHHHHLKHPTRKQCKHEIHHYPKRFCIDIVLYPVEMGRLCMWNWAHHVSINFIASSKAISINHINKFPIEMYFGSASIKCDAHISFPLSPFFTELSLPFILVVLPKLDSVQGLHSVCLCTQHFVLAMRHSSYLRMEINCMNVRHF